MFSLYLSFKVTNFKTQPAADIIVSSFSAGSLCPKSLEAEWHQDLLSVGAGKGGFLGLPEAVLIPILLLSGCQISCPQVGCSFLSSPNQSLWKRSGLIFILEKTHTCPWPHINIDLFPFHISVQGSLHLALANVLFV